MTKRLSLACALLVVALVVVYAGCQKPPSATGARFTVRSAGEGADTRVRLVSDSVTNKCYAVVGFGGGVTSLGEVPCDSNPSAEKP